MGGLWIGRYSVVFSYYYLLFLCNAGCGLSSSALTSTVVCQPVLPRRIRVLRFYRRNRAPGSSSLLSAALDYIIYRSA